MQRNKKIFINIILYSFILFFSFVLSINALSINSKNVILYNLNDDEVIYEKNSKEIISIASLTKIMTSIVTIENIDNLDTYITLEKADFLGLEGYSLAGFKVGDNITYRDLLYGALLPSGAEAALALSNHVFTNKEEFLNLMNELAIKIGLKNTKFDNPIGMDSDNNYSTVEDVSILLKYALNNEEFKKIFTTREYTTSNNLKLESTLLLKNKILNKDISYIQGSKTGTTNKAGLCLASIANLSDVSYMLVTCNAPYKGTYPYNLEDATNIYTYYDENYGYQKIINKDQVFTKIKVINSTIKELLITSDEDISIYMNNEIDSSNLKYEYVGEDKIDYKYKYGDKLGVVNVIYDDNILYTFPVILNKNIKRYPYLLITSIILLSLIIILLVKKIIRSASRKKKRRNKVRR